MQDGLISKGLPPQPATSGDIVYRAYQRPYAGGSGQVIVLLASCSYPVAPYEIYFVPEQGAGDNFVLMEQPPSIFYNIISYYAASYSTQAGLANPVKNVNIRDAHGVHTVALEPMK